MKKLQPSDLELLQFLADGLTPLQIAMRTERNYNVTKNRLGKIKEFMGADTTVHAVAIALRQSLID